MSGDDYPISINEEGIKLKTERMVPEQLYHCLFGGKVYLFYKDDTDLLHCYEVEDENTVKEIEKDPSDIENILKKHAET